MTALVEIGGRARKVKLILVTHTVRLTLLVDNVPDLTEGYERALYCARGYQGPAALYSLHTSFPSLTVLDKRIMLTHVVAQSWERLCSEGMESIQKSFKDTGRRRVVIIMRISPLHTTRVFTTRKGFRSRMSTVCSESNL